MKFEVRATSQRRTSVVEYDPKGVRVPVPVDIQLVGIDDEGGGRNVGGKVVAKATIPHSFLESLAEEVGWELPAKPAPEPEPADAPTPKSKPKSKAKPKAE